MRPIDEGSDGGLVDTMNELRYRSRPRMAGTKAGIHVPSDGRNHHYTLYISTVEMPPSRMERGMGYRWNEEVIIRTKVGKVVGA